MIDLDIVARLQLWLDQRGGGSIIGDRDAALLQGIERTGSIKEGAKLAGVSYRTAWATVRTMERALGRPIVQSRTGGPGGGASVLTEDARELLRLYQDLRRQLDERLEQAFGLASRLR
jgi:molybdate transport system regulatory protein